MFKTLVLRVLLVAVELTEWSRLQVSRVVGVLGPSLLPLSIATHPQVFPDPLARLGEVSNISTRSKSPTELGELRDPKSPLLYPLSNENVEIQRVKGLCKSSACVLLDSGTLPPPVASPGEQAVVSGLPGRGLRDKREGVSSVTLLPIWLVFLESS